MKYSDILNPPDKNCKQDISHWKSGLTGYLKIIEVQNQSPIHFGTDLTRIK